jgi:hypothetical protein
MKLLNIRPEYINEELARKICKNKELKREYIRKYELEGGGDNWKYRTTNIKRFV